MNATVSAEATALGVARESAAPAFEHHHAAHCESGVMSNLMRHHGVPMTESLAFGLASGLSFAYLPFIKLSGLPLIAYRMPPRAIIKGLMKPMAATFRFETFRSPQAGEARLDALLDSGHIVGLQTSVYWLPYFPPDMRFHFNAHNLLVYGRAGDQYLISDPVFEAPVTCSRADLARARFAKGALQPKGLLYYPEGIGRTTVDAKTVLAAIAKTTRVMLAPVPIAGVRGIRTLANKVASLPTDGDPAAPDTPAARTAAFVGHIVRMQEEIGTGGAGFRFIYAAFLQEAATIADAPRLAEFAERLTPIGDDWRMFALKAARMIKGRERLDPTSLAERLRELARQEESFFRDLRAAVR
jgi:Domain of unknown function (DUF4872)/Butirosin biosynthesis protein H, N-terminal